MERLVLKGERHNFHEEAGWELLSVLHLGRDWSSSPSAPPYKCQARLPGCSWACAGLSRRENLGQSGSAAARVSGRAVLGRHAWQHSLSPCASVWRADPAWAHALQVRSGVGLSAGGLCRGSGCACSWWSVLVAVHALRRLAWGVGALPGLVALLLVVCRQGLCPWLPRWCCQLPEREGRHRQDYRGLAMPKLVWGPWQPTEGWLPRK